MKTNDLIRMAIHNYQDQIKKFYKINLIKKFKNLVNSTLNTF